MLGISWAERGQMLLSRSGQMLGRAWADAGQILGQILGRCCAEPGQMLGQILSRCLEDPGQMLGRCSVVFGYLGKRNPSRCWADAGQILGGCWGDLGHNQPILVKKSDHFFKRELGPRGGFLTFRGKESKQMLGRCWANPGQMLGRSWSQLGEILLGSS